MKNVFVDGYFERLSEFETHDDLFVYQKKYDDEIIIVIINLGQTELTYDQSLIKDKKVILSNYHQPNAKLRAYEAIVIMG